MIEGHSPVVQALLGTVFTWGLTFLGAAMAVFMQVTANTSRESSERTETVLCRVTSGGCSTSASASLRE